MKRTEEKNEEKLDAALHTPKMVISVSGPSKTGKTALVNTLITADRIIPVTGQSLRSSNDLWQSVMRWIGGPEEIEKITERVLKAGAAGKASAEAGVILAKGKAEREINGGLSSQRQRQRNTASSFLKLLSTSSAKVNLSFS